MIAVRVFSVIAALAMVGVIVFGFVSGDLSGEGLQIWGLAWGKVTLVDLYLGLAIFAAWVAFRERHRAVFRTAIWWVALGVLGNLAAAVYLTWASFSSSDVRELLLGRDRPTGPIGRHESV